MSRPRVPLAALCGAGSLVFAASCTLACPTGSSLPLGSILHGGNAGCADPCATDCAPGPTPSPTFTEGGRGTPPFNISMVDFAFLPGSVIIKPNTLVRWTNNSPFFQHTSTRVPTWNSGFVNPNQHFDFTFTATHAGLEYHYVCTIHFGMEADLAVAHFGDANLDGVVNLGDFNILAANFGQSGRTWETGDFNGDGTVNLSDFNMLAANFGRSIQPALTTLEVGFSTSVPEASMMSFMTPLLLLVRRRRT